MIKHYFPELDYFLRLETKNEIWHQENPGSLSKKYNSINYEIINGEKIYLFDLAVDMMENGVFIFKESRYTSVPAHRFIYPEINYIYSGSCDFCIEGKTYTLNQGDMLILEPDVIHSTSFKSSDDIIVSIALKDRYFEDIINKSDDNGENIIFNFFAESMNKARKKNHFFIYRENDESELVSMTAQMLLYTYFGIRNEKSSILIREYVHLLLLHLVSAACNSEMPNKSLVKEDRLIMLVLQKLQKDPKTCNLREIAEENNYNYYYFSDLFKKSTGVSFSTIKKDFQLSNACMMLRETKENIDDIGLHCGFSNLTYFYQAFRKKYNMTPNEYRNKFKI
ncbi:MAG: helix-turn-helix transcriptional regulator [Holdemanella sp.]|nr:helix-turn-helix transcriptional regulator [Holdemanella sp.]